MHALKLAVALSTFLGPILAIIKCFTAILAILASGSVQNVRQAPGRPYSMSPRTALGGLPLSRKFNYDHFVGRFIKIEGI